MLYFLDPVILPSSLKYQRSANFCFDFTFFPTLLTLLTTTLYGNIYTVYTIVGYVDLPTLKNCPQMMYHQIMPPITWPQCDLAVLIAILTSSAIYSTFHFNPYSAGRYEMIAGEKVLIFVINGKSKSFLYNYFLQFLFF